MRLRLFGLVLLIPLVLFVVGCGDDDSDGADESSTTTLHVIEHADTDVLQHVGPADEDDSVGDVLGFANELYDENNEEVVGSDNGMCMRTAVGEAFECVWTATLDDGQLTVEGPFYDDKDSTLAITGGTGAYSSASGEMTLHARDDKGTEYDFTYEIVTDDD